MIKLHVVYQTVYIVPLLEFVVNVINGTYGMEVTVLKGQAYFAKMEQKVTFPTSVTTTVQVIHMR